MKNKFFGLFFAFLILRMQIQEAIAAFLWQSASYVSVSNPMCVKRLNYVYFQAICRLYVSSVLFCFWFDLEHFQ